MTDKARLSNEAERPEARAPEASPLPYYCLTTPAWMKLAVVRHAASIIRLLEAKFGAIDVATRTRITQAPVDRLMDWSEKLLNARSVADVFR